MTREGTPHHAGPAPAAHRLLHAALSAEPLDPTRAHHEVWAPTAGAVVDFAGIVRDHDGGRTVERLSYTAHPSAEEALTRVAREVAAAHPSVRIWAAHRVGDLHIGDHALVVAVASAHRAEAFAACAELVEQIKAQVPIWKEQFFADGAKEWVGID
ncbi:molybdenum cofactor biosynthesis protein MoaE [Nesterenkonia xinjiangensis]|uniref:molybdenum cofactor biosynthesis protein MoaE n=1 Tax=Nesterenkonia xinjiangensis TaxID=225327 RepID=UPI0015CD1B37|nr:molybdenum cofactor biosynthesis protein MoaE [Nesterenkonia xinjiangensis]